MSKSVYEVIEEMGTKKFADMLYNTAMNKMEAQALVITQALTESLRNQIALDIEHAHNNCGHSGKGDDWCECCADRWHMVGNCTCLKAIRIARGEA